MGRAMEARPTWSARVLADRRFAAPRRVSKRQRTRGPLRAPAALAMSRTRARTRERATVRAFFEQKIGRRRPVPFLGLPTFLLPSYGPARHTVRQEHRDK